MPIWLPDLLPARRVLLAEGIGVLGADALVGPVRPLRIGLLNLMPNKIDTETQIARLLGATPIPVELVLVRITDDLARSAGDGHASAFYRPWSALRSEYFDGFIITGAPVERLPFEDVRYWSELQTILDWTQIRVHRTLTICWAAQAALYHFHGVQKQELPRKAFGVFAHANRGAMSPYLRGLPDQFDVPVSRWTEIAASALAAADGLELLADSATTGVGFVGDDAHGMLHMFNHLEYDTGTLDSEYRRDGAGRLPVNYFPDDDPRLSPSNSWRGHAHLLFGNWLREIQRTLRG